MSKESVIQSNDALRNFEYLPNSAHIRLTTMMALYGCSSATIWRGCKNGLIPKPKKLTLRTTAWNVGEVRIALHLNKGVNNE
jgi:predicted DNA-binding transcriptional regulator AlpA